MRLGTVLTIAAVLACVRPAAAALTNVPLVAVDPQGTQTPAQIFVRDSRASVQTDDGASVHGAGLRPPRPDDDPAAPVYDASGNGLLFTLEKWRAGTGAVDVGSAGEGFGDRISVNARRLIAFGHYSIFIRTDAADGPRFTPLDGSGLANNFDAREDGSANVTIDAPQHLAAGSWLVTIYHSDAQDHGNSPGDFMHTAHQQLIVKVP